VMSRREGLEFESEILSDCAPVTATVRALLESGIRVHCLRDLTRGGLAAALHEIVRSARISVALEESHIPVWGAVRSACEIFGLDPIYSANEGRFAAFVAAGDAGKALEILRADDPNAAEIGGVVRADTGAAVTMRTSLGIERFVDLPSGDQLPRIC